MKPYTTIKKEKTYAGIILDVVNETITLPDGKEALREIVVRGPATAIVAIDHDERIIFVRQYRAPVHETLLELPAGMMDDGEEPLECAARELTEETGKIAGKITPLFGLYPSVGFCTEKIHIFLAENLLQGEQSLDDDEFISIEKYTPDEAVAMVFSGAIKDSKTIAGVLAYNELLRKRT